MMKEMTEEQRKAAVKMLRDKAKEILNDPVDEKRDKPEILTGLYGNITEEEFLKGLRELLTSER